MVWTEMPRSDFELTSPRGKTWGNPKGYKMSVAVIRIPPTKNRHPVCAKRLLKRTESKTNKQIMQIYKGNYHEKL